MTDLLLTLGGLVILVIGAELLVRGAVDLALRARISPLVVGLTVVSFGTSAPELIVSLLAALDGNSAISIGNVVGSNIVNISLILGLSVLIFPIEVDRDSVRIHWPVMMLASLVFWWMIQNDHFSRWEGLLFFLAQVAYVTWMVISSRKASAREGHEAPASTVPLWRSILLLVTGIVGLAQGADWFVEGAVSLAKGLGVSEQLIGVTIVAIGTSLPELVTSMVAAFRKEADISLGNLVGSNVFNLLGIIGIASMVMPIQVDHEAFNLDVMAMLAVSLLIYPLMRFGMRMGRWQGALLTVAYLAYIVLVLRRG